MAASAFLAGPGGPGAKSQAGLCPLSPSTGRAVPVWGAGGRAVGSGVQGPACQYASAPCEPCQEHLRAISGWFWGSVVSPAPSQPCGGVSGLPGRAGGRAAGGEEPWRCGGLAARLRASTRCYQLLVELRGARAGGEFPWFLQRMSSAVGGLAAAGTPSDESQEAFSEGRSKNCASAALTRSFLSFWRPFCCHAVPAPPSSLARTGWLWGLPSSFPPARVI